MVANHLRNHRRSPSRTHPQPTPTRKSHRPNPPTRILRPLQSRRHPHRQRHLVARRARRRPNRTLRQQPNPRTKRQTRRRHPSPIQTRLGQRKPTPPTTKRRQSLRRTVLPSIQPNRTMGLIHRSRRLTRPIQHPHPHLGHTTTTNRRPRTKPTTPTSRTRQHHRLPTPRTSPTMEPTSPHPSRSRPR